MKSKYAKITKNEIETCILPFIPRNKRGFAPKVDLADVIQCIIYKLKTGVQWENLFIDIKGVKPVFSWQLVYYYYKKWRDCGVFYRMNKFYLEQKKGLLDLSKLNLDGTHSYVKKISGKCRLSAPQKRQNLQCSDADRRQWHSACGGRYFKRQS